MDGFFFVPHLGEKMQQRSDSAGGAGQQVDGAAGTDGQAESQNSFAKTVREKLDEREKERDRCSRRRETARKRKEKERQEKILLEKRAKRRKLFMDLAQKAWYKHENELKFQEQIAFARKEVSSAILKQHSIERATGESAELEENPAVLSKAAAELAQAYVFFKIPSARVNPRPKVGR